MFLPLKWVKAVFSGPRGRFTKYTSGTLSFSHSYLHVRECKMYKHDNDDMHTWKAAIKNSHESELIRFNKPKMLIDQLYSKCSIILNTSNIQS